MALHLTAEDRDVAHNQTLPFLVDKAVPDTERVEFDKGWWSVKRPQHMNPVILFPPRGRMLPNPHYKLALDIATVPKNASSSLRSLYALIVIGRGVDNELGVLKREQMYNRNGVDADYPWRSHTIRVAIKRDPVERAFSAATHILNRRYGWMDPTPDDYEKFFMGIHPSLRYDRHLIPQYEILGKDVGFFDEIYYTKDFRRFADNIRKTYVPHESVDPSTNWTDVKKVVGRYSNVSVEDLSSDCIDRIKWLYRYDYEYGWC